MFLHGPQAPQMRADTLSRPLGLALILATAGMEVLRHILLRVAQTCSEVT